MKTTKIIANQKENEALWKAQHTSHVTGTDVAAILGLGKFKGNKTPLDVYLKKKYPSSEDHETFNILYSMGHAVEAVLAEWYESVTGSKVVLNSNFYEDEERPWIGGTPDAFAYNEDGTVTGLEFKSANYMNRSEFIEGVLGMGGVICFTYEMQIRLYMYLMDIDEYRLIVYIHDGICSEANVKVITITRDRYKEADMLRIIDAFWHENMEKNVAPEQMDDVSEEAYRTFCKNEIKPVDEAITLEEAGELFSRHFQLEDEKKNLKDQISKVEDELRGIDIKLTQAANGADKVSCRDGDFLYTRQIKTTERATIDSKRLKAELPDIADSYMKITVSVSPKYTRKEAVNG